MKGQIFVIISLVVLLVLAAVMAENKIIDTINISKDNTFATEVYENIESELRYAADLGIANNHSSETIDEYVSNFTDFIKDEEDVEILYIISNFNDVGSTFNITVGNYLTSEITNVDVSQNLTGGTSDLGTINNTKSKTTSFSSDPGSETIIEVSVEFTFSGESFNETFITKAGPFDYSTVYYNFKLIEGNVIINEKFQANKRD